MKFFIPTVVMITLSCQEVMSISKKKPNVLFILADDLGYTDLSCMGSKYYETPNIDRIFREGMVFTNGYAACQVSSPSRASILTGKFPVRHGITDWIGAKAGESWREMKRYTKLLPPEYVHNLSSSYITLPEALKEGGYKTFFAGKWHLGSKGSWPENHGFDINKGGWDAGSPIGGYFAPWVNPTLPNGHDGEELSMRLAKETINFIKENKDTTFFAFLSFYAVHAPLETTQEKWSKYRDKAEKIGIAKTGFKMGHFLPMRQVQDHPIYAGLIETMDDAIGIVLNALDDLKLAENTIVIFTSDNGGVVSGDAYSTSNKPLKGGKGYQFEGGILVPYFVKVPWLNIAGKKSSVPVTGTDFYPTLLQLVGLRLKPEEHNDGMSLLPLLKGGMIPERPLIWHYPHYSNQGGDPTSIIRRGKWKLIHYYEDGHEELYNLETDLEEDSDISLLHPKLTKQLSKQLFDFLYKVGAKFPQKNSLYNSTLEKDFLIKNRIELLPFLEKQRMQFLSKTFDPGNNWWGSKVSQSK
jgi:arylsulfatase A-like enzyme